MIKTEDGLVTIICDKCGTQNVAMDAHAGIMFFVWMWKLLPGKDLCVNCRIGDNGQSSEAQG